MNLNNTFEIVAKQMVSKNLAREQMTDGETITFIYHLLVYLSSNSSKIYDSFEQIKSRARRIQEILDSLFYVVR